MTNDVLIIGAGLSGLQAAFDLQAGGKKVVVLDKGRGVGGRAATRRWEGTRVDHGAQFFTVRTQTFRAQVRRWQAHELCFKWTEGFHQWDDDGRGLRAPEPEAARHEDVDTSHGRYACRQGMSLLCKNIAEHMAPGRVRVNARVTRLRMVDDGRGNEHWQAEVEGASPEDEAGEPYPANGRTLILTLPVPQALELLERSDLLGVLDPEAVRDLQAVRVAPCLAVMLRGVAPQPEWKGIQLRDETVTWIGADSDKRPGSDEPGERERTFVLHGSAEFSRRWQDADLEEAAGKIVARAGEIVGAWITRLPKRQVHRWRYASVESGLKMAAGLRASQPRRAALFVAGDAFLGAKIEGAFLSGKEVAAVILSEPVKPLVQMASLPPPFVKPVRGMVPGLIPPGMK